MCRGDITLTFMGLFGGFSVVSVLAIAKKLKVVEERTLAVSVHKIISKGVIFSYVTYVSIKTYKQYCVQRDYVVVCRTMH